MVSDALRSDSWLGAIWSVMVCSSEEPLPLSLSAIIHSFSSTPRSSQAVAEVKFTVCTPPSSLISAVAPLMILTAGSSVSLSSHDTAMPRARTPNERIKDFVLIVYYVFLLLLTLVLQIYYKFIVDV